MNMPYLLFLVLLLVLGVALFLGVSTILKKTALKPTMVKGNAFVVALIAGMMLHGMTPRVYIVTGKTQVLKVEEKVALWGSSYTATDGTGVSFSIPTGSCAVINHSEALVAVEPVLYGDVDESHYEIKVLEMPGHAVCPTPRIKLMPHEVPGGFIKVRDRSDGQAVYWIREFFEDEYNEETE